ncbi:MULTISPECIES: HEAT repeat domain-containing protein [Streptomyces]|uniref:HEAT repeat domain-containing protein n=2 Tax=Streptomyces TaxID=1883 RepID=A0ABU4KGR2_9ACTN|nr:HEAT repeat domain-containing protein [Streptomyces roseolus]MDX2296975.1 HEAT repeat domain-containing protein [Streptomyces roseolus]
MALAVAPEGPPDGWREWGGEVLVPSVRVASLRAEIVREPAVLRGEERGEALYQAVRGLGADDCAHVGRLAGELAGSRDAVLEGEAVRLAGEGLRAGVLGAGFVRDTLTGLLGSRSGSVVNRALAALAEPWAVVPPLPADRFAGLFRPATADAALTAAVAHGHGEPLWRAAADPDQAPRVRKRALALYGETALRGDVPAVLRLAGQDPLLLAGPAVECLRAMHRRGHFATGPDVPAVLDLALADHTVPVRAVATVLFTARHDVLRLAAETAPDDPAWPRRLDLLVALDEQGVGGLPVAAEIARLLPLAAAPGPFLRALRALRDPGTEDAVLAALPHAPADALDALEAVGGERTVRVLGAALGLDACARADAVPEPGGVERALRAHRQRALELVWLLATEPAVRRELLVRMDAAALPARVAADLGGPDERELALLAAHLDPDRPADALTRLAEHAGPGLLPVLADLLLRIAGEAASAWEPGGAKPVPDEEPTVPPEVVTALCRLGRRLHARGRIRPVCLLDARDAEAAGSALVTDLTLGLLARPGLTAGERTVLLRLLLDLPEAPHRTIRRRVHPLLRHPDRHVRKHAVALLARDADGDGVEAVSATLLALTGPDRDPQTVRRTLSALGDAGARWASDAIAACLDHPQANVRKTAARALATAGTARAVPRLLHRLGRDDNPGLRALLVDALRALLGDTLAAAVTAAADQAADARVRERLLAALAAGPDPDPDGTDIARLTRDGWDPDTALRLAARPAPAARLRPTRPYLAEWLALATASARARRAVLAVLPDGVCPAPRTARERDVLARHVTVLLGGLAEAEGERRDGILGLLEEIADRPPVGAEVIFGVRALPPRAPGRRSTLPLLRRAGAVVVRADLDRELSAAARASDPARARAAVLREAFGIARPDNRSDAPTSWYGELAAATRSVRELAAYRQRGAAVGSRDLLAALAGLHTGATPDVRDALLDWMTDLQPLGAPPWTLAEEAHAADSAPRVPRPADLDQPRSAAQRERLLALLGSDSRQRRNTAAHTLLAWPEPQARAAALDAHLRGRTDEPADPALRTALGRALTEADPETLRGAGVRPDRVARIAATALGARELQPLLPVLLHLWEHAEDGDARADAFGALRRLPADALAAHLEPRLAAGATGLLDLVAGRRLLRTPVLDRLRTRHPEAGLDLVDGPLHGPEAAGQQAAALRALRQRAPVPVPPRPSGPTDDELVALLRSPEPPRVRRTLAHLTERSATLRPDRLETALRELLGHPETGVRLHAHRTSRALLDRDAHLRLTEVLLGDPQPDVVRTAIRVLSQARWRPAVPAFVALLDHGRATVRRAAEEAVLRAGPEAVPLLRRSASHARPDRRAGYESLLARIRDDERREAERRDKEGRSTRGR